MMDKKDFEWMFKTLRLANAGAAEAKAKAHKRGIPYVAAISGKPAYIMPNGSVKAKYKYSLKS
jgi:hypothetical protein